MAFKPFKVLTNILSSLTRPNTVLKGPTIPNFKTVASKKGIINVGGKIQSAYNFAKKLNPKVKKTRINTQIKQLIGTNTSMNTNKLKRLI